MKAAGITEHLFSAPIAGVACRFSLHCDGGKPTAIFGVDDGGPNKPDSDICSQLAALNALIAKGLPWGAVRLQHQGDIGAVIEAAEARLAELYGAIDEVPA
jgi:hypothetical protein